MSESTTRRVAMVWDQHERPKHDLLFEMAKGYMHAAIVVLEEQERAENVTYYNLLPGHFALQQAVELFLKAAISLKGNPIPVGRGGHDLKRLYSLYRRLFSDETLAFQCRVSELIDWGRSYANGQDARYPFDREGNVWFPHAHINVEATLEVFRDFSADFERLESALRKAAEAEKVSAA